MFNDLRIWISVKIAMSSFGNESLGVDLDIRANSSWSHRFIKSDLAGLAKPTLLNSTGIMKLIQKTDSGFRSSMHLFATLINHYIYVIITSSNMLKAHRQRSFIWHTVVIYRWFDKQWT